VYAQVNARLAIESNEIKLNIHLGVVCPDWQLDVADWLAILSRA
jgi:hypothetical protein